MKDSLALGQRMTGTLVRGKRSLTMPLTVIVVLMIYIISMPNDLSWSYFGGDGGELITASVTLGIPHPPGYPTYVVLGKLFSYIPFGTLASRYHLLSAVAMSIAAGFVAQMSLEHKNLRAEGDTLYAKGIYLPGVAAGLIFALFPLVWSQAIIAEVYALNLTFLSALTWVLFNRRGGLAAGILLGLSVTTHITSLLMLPLCLLLLRKTDRRAFAFGCLLGLIPLLTLLIFAGGSSPVMWGQPKTVVDWFWLVSGRLYMPNIFGLALTGWVERIQAWVFLLLAPMILLFFSVRHLRSKDYWRLEQRSIVFVLLTALLFTGYAFGYSTPDAAVLLLPAFLLMSIVIGFGIGWSGRFSLLLPLSVFIIGSLFLRSEVIPPIRQQFEQSLSGIPTDAIIVTPGDQTVAATWYFAYAEGQRPDVIVVDDNMFQFSWYRANLAQKYPGLDNLEDDNLPAFIKTNSEHHDVCWLSMVHDIGLICEDNKL